MPAPDATPSELPFEQLLHRPEVVAAVRRVLSKYGFKKQDLEDGYNSVVVMALEMGGALGESRAGAAGAEGEVTGQRRRVRISLGERSRPQLQ